MAYQPVGTMLGQGRRVAAAVNQITSGTLAARPAAGTADNYYWATDVDILYRDTGAAWEIIATRGAQSLTFNRTGRYYWNLMSGGFFNNNQVITADVMYANYFIVPKTTTFDRIAICTQTAEAAVSARLGIYEDDNGYPGDLLLDAGIVSLAAPAGMKAIVIDQQLIGGNLYHLISLSNATGTATQWLSWGGGGGSAGHPTTLANVTQNQSWTVAQAYGALPDPFTAGGTAGEPLYAMGLRLASIP